MRAVYCPFCDNIQNQVGFRPMTFFCENCGSEGDWWNGREIGIDRGLIAWFITDDTLRFWADIFMDAFQIVETLFNQFEGLVKAFIDQVRLAIAAIKERILEESYKLEPDQEVIDICKMLIEELRALVQAVLEYVQLTTELANDKTDQVINFVENALYQLMLDHQEDLSGEDAGDVAGSGAEMLMFSVDSGANAVAGVYADGNGMMVGFISMVAEIVSRIPD
jgi:hypothetical protein